MAVKYIQIAADLANKIKHEQYAAGDFLPSEPTLSQLYNVSRETIRKALTELADAGLIQKIQGKGSVVINAARIAFPVSNIESFDELNKQKQMHAATKIIELTDARVPFTISKHLSLTETAATYVKRLRLINHEPIVVDEDYILKKYVPQISPQQAQSSLYHYFEHDLGLEIDYATKTITVEPASASVIKQLQLTNTNLVVVIRSLTYLKDTSFFQYTISQHRPDKFKFVDFAHRKNKNGGLIL